MCDSHDWDIAPFSSDGILTVAMIVTVIFFNRRAGQFDDPKAY